MKHYNLQNYDTSIINLERAIKLYPKKIGKFYVLLGMMYYDLDNIKKAKFYALKAIEINPEHESSNDLLKLIQAKTN